MPGSWDGGGAVITIPPIVDELERREARGELAVVAMSVHAAAGMGDRAKRAPGLAKSTRELHASRCLADLVARLADDSDKPRTADRESELECSRSSLR